MALLHRVRKNGVNYEIRTAGASRRLYTNGAFHTQYHPKHLFTGAIWDCLSLPSLCLETPPENALILGVGGGTVIHQLQQLHSLTSVTGVELDAMHINLAKNYFSLRYPNLNIVHADARDWLNKATETFDYIVDDVFLHVSEEHKHTGADPSRGATLDTDWFRLLKNRLSPGGVIVQNHIDEKHAKFARRQLRNSTMLGFAAQGFENQVLAAMPPAKSAAEYRAQLASRLNSIKGAERRRLRVSLSHPVKLQGAL